MRLSNRIAATALAAVMAVSMLTACGGGGGGSTGGNGGGNGGGSGNNGGSTSVAVPAPDKFENVGTGSESEGGGSGTLGTPIASFSGSKYAHPDSDGVQYYVTEYKTIQYTTNGLCQWPKDGYKVYKYVSTSESDGTATIVLADEAGKQYTITIVEGVPNGLTVTDENGNNVTDQFKWLMQGE